MKNEEVKKKFVSQKVGISRSTCSLKNGEQIFSETNKIIH